MRELPDRPQIRIVEAYRDYTPPLNVASLIRQLLDSVPERCLRGLDCVVLTNEAGLSKRERLPRGSRRKRKGKVVFGRYRSRSRSGGSYIELRVDNIVAALKGWKLHIPFLRNFVFGHILFHEIGHHIHRLIRPEYKEKEGVANKWAGRLNVNFMRKKYWYATFLIRPGAKLYKSMRRNGWI